MQLAARTPAEINYVASKALWRETWSQFWVPAIPAIPWDSRMAGLHLLHLMETLLFDIRVFLAIKQWKRPRILARPCLIQ